jgi:hypothetical protein
MESMKGIGRKEKEDPSKGLTGGNIFGGRNEEKNERRYCLI